MKRHVHSLQGIPDGKYREARRLRREMTSSERILWMRLRKNQAGGFHFRRQHVIRGFIVDFYCHKVKLVIEVDGEIHRLQGENDQIRDDVLRSEGIMVQRFPNEKIKNQLDEVFHEIVEICNLRSGLGRNS